MFSAKVQPAVVRSLRQDRAASNLAYRLRDCKVRLVPAADRGESNEVNFHHRLSFGFFGLFGVSVCQNAEHPEGRAKDGCHGDSKDGCYGGAKDRCHAHEDR